MRYLPKSAAAGPFHVGINQAVRRYRVLKRRSLAHRLPPGDRRREALLLLIGSVDQIGTTAFVTHVTDLPRRFVSLYDDQLSGTPSPTGE